MKNFAKSSFIFLVLSISISFAQAAPFALNMVNQNDIGRSGNDNTPSYNLNISEALNYTASYATHYGFILNSTQMSGGTGDRIGMASIQTCSATLAGKSCVGGSDVAVPAGNAVGNYTGSNPRVIVPTGLTGPIGAAVGIEANTETHSPVLIKNGLRIADENQSGGATTHGTLEDAAIAIVNSSGNTAQGYTEGIQFGEAAQGFPQNWPILAGGTLIQAWSPNVTLSYGLDLTGSTAGYSRQAIALPTNTSGNGISWGTVNTAGTINSSSTLGYGSHIVFTDNGVNVEYVDGSVHLTLIPSQNVPILLAPITISGLPPCNVALQGSLAYINDATASSAPTFHGAVSGGGSTSVQSLVSCNGSIWQYN
ncbi:hypothetical protein [Burkholderia gladioli]|uniref:hypothetical protein n=1 Tax=Burkholderia gladioli TaxID=28095 RepID=UPI003D1AF50D